MKAAAPQLAPAASAVAFAGPQAAGRTRAPSLVPDVLRTSGQPLPPATRIEMETLFGHDFLRVRIHADRAAAASARELHANAYALGSDIVFGEGRYNPSSSVGRRLLAHELTHVVQQRGGGDRSALRVTEPRRAETEAHSLAGRAAAGERVIVRETASCGIQCEESDEPLSLRSTYNPGAHHYNELLAEAGRIHRWLEKNPADSPERAALVAKLADIVATANRLAAREGYPPLNFVDARSFSKTPQQAQASDELKKLSPPSAASPLLEPPKPMAPQTPAPKPAPAEVLTTYAVWGPLFIEGLKEGLQADAKLQSGLQTLQAQLASTQGKAEFGGGMAVGVVPGALVAIGDIPYSLFKLLVESGLKNATPMSKEETQKAVAELVAGVKKLAVRLPELAGEVASQPKQAGGWAAVLASEKIREDLLLEEPPASEKKAPETTGPSAAKTYNPFDYSDVVAPDLYKSARDLITRGKAGQKGGSIFNKGVAGGMALGYALMNIAMLFLSPEEMAAKAGSVGAKGMEALKATNLWKRLGAMAEGIPELKAFAGAKRAAADVKAGQTAVKGAENLGAAATEQAGKPAATPSTTKPSNRIPSHGELQEEPIRKAFHPKAQMLSEKSAGFDFAEGQRVVSAHTEQKGNLTVVTERIAGGNWIQLKSVTAEEQVVANIDKAMERAESALKGVPKNELEKAAETPGRKLYEKAPENLKPGRENQFERMQGGHAYRTSYARQPDRITIHLHFENVPAGEKARLDQLATRAREAVTNNPYRADIPPVTVLVTGK